MSGQSQPSRLTLPPAFPDDLFGVVKDRVATKAPIGSSSVEHLGGSYNGVRYRLKACADYSEEFTHSINTFGESPPFIQRYQQERSLFGFFVSGYSVLDSFSFFMYTAAAQIDPTHFPMQKPGHLKGISCKTTPDVFAKAFSGEAIATELTKLIADPTFTQWDDFRNILAHRTAPGRAFYASFGTSIPDPPADWKIAPAANLKIDADLTQCRLAWLVNTLAKLVSAADVFAQKHF
jgi:hypothetical protein